MSFQRLVGHRELVAGLLGELARRPSHAYLLAGPRGVGKAIVAQGLAHSILCERAPGADFCCAPENCATRIAAASSARRANAPGAPRCGCCAGCVQVAAGVHPDYTYVSRQSNRTEVLIEQVRDLIERLGIRPSRGPRRVAIVDDAETLNLPAQNALLKTLEEPPGHTIVFLVTDAEQALLDTVRSRMRPVRFGPLTVAEIAAALKLRAHLLTAERANALARLARGSLARALAMSEGAAPPITELVDALSRAKTLDFAMAQRIAQDFFGARDEAADNFELIARILEEMLCFKLLHEELNAPSPETARIMTELAQKLSPATLAELIDAALKAAAAVEAMANSRLQAEHWLMTAGAALSAR